MQTSVGFRLTTRTLRSARRVATVVIGVVVLATACASVAATTPSRTTSTPPRVETAPNAFGEEIVVRTNGERRKLGLPTLARNAALMSAAQLQADQMAARNTMAHDLPGSAYPSPRSRLDAVGYRMSASGENVAEGYPTPTAVVTGWMTSTGHRANIVSTTFSEMGAGMATAKNGRKFYAQVFGHPRFGS
jgi:uncharacterized protein YkwD